MKINVDQEKCIGCGACVAIDSDNFDFNDDGLSTVINDNVTEKTRNAIEACPVYAILIEDPATKEEKAEETTTSTCSCRDEEKCEEECRCDEHSKCNEDSESKECRCSCNHCSCEEEEEKEAA